MVKISLKELLHQRIYDKCLKLFNDDHYQQASLEAFKQVEIAIKEKSGILDRKICGKNLVNKVFSQGQGFKLRAFDPSLQKEVREFFSSAFGYYRNYLAHNDLDTMSKSQCLRILILSTELLNIIDISCPSLFEFGGVDGLVANRMFENKSEVARLLSFLNGINIVDLVVDGLFEELATSGFSDEQYTAMFEFGLIECQNSVGFDACDQPVEICTFVLTPLGEETLNELL